MDPVSPERPAADGTRHDTRDCLRACAVRFLTRLWPVAGERPYRAQVGQLPAEARPHGAPPNWPAAPHNATPANAAAPRDAPLAEDRAARAKGPKSRGLIRLAKSGTRWGPG